MRIFWWYLLAGILTGTFMRPKRVRDVLVFAVAWPVLLTAAVYVCLVFGYVKFQGDSDVRRDDD